jgi:hypothetical protein
VEDKAIISLLTEMSGNLAKIAGLIDGGNPSVSSETAKLLQSMDQFLQHLKPSEILNQPIPKTTETIVTPVIDISKLLNSKQVLSELLISERTLRRNSGEGKLIKPIRILGSNYYDPQNIEEVKRFFMK